jgi:hypothetical protein
MQFNVYVFFISSDSKPVAVQGGEEPGTLTVPTTPIAVQGGEEPGTLTVPIMTAAVQGGEEPGTLTVPAVQPVVLQCPSTYKFNYDFC